MYRHLTLNDKYVSFLVEPVTLVDLVVYTQEHNELHYDSSGKIKCQGKGWKPFYECYHRIIQTAPNCSLPTTRYINKDIIDRNCTTYGEIKQFQNAFIKSMYEVQDECPRPCQIRAYDLQVCVLFFRSRNCFFSPIVYQTYWYTFVLFAGPFDVCQRYPL